MSKEMNEEMDNEGRIKRIKKHVRKNRKEYIIGAAALTAGVVIGLLVKSRPEITQLVIKIRGDHNNPNMTYQTITNYGNIVGRPGNEVIDLDTMKKYASQHLAALSAGVSDNSMFRHLSGDYPDVNGRRFARILAGE